MKKAAGFGGCAFWSISRWKRFPAGICLAEDAAQMIAETRKVALEMFPGKERAFDLIYRPQFQRVMHAVYRLQ